MITKVSDGSSFPRGIVMTTLTRRTPDPISQGHWLKACHTHRAPVVVCFHSRDQQPCFSTKTKGSVRITIEFNSRRIGSGPPWPQFLCLGTPTWRPWRHVIRLGMEWHTGYGPGIAFFATKFRLVFSHYAEKYYAFVWKLCYNIINRGYYMAARRCEISLRVLKAISLVRYAHSWNILCLFLHKHQLNTKSFLERHDFICNHNNSNLHVWRHIIFRCEDMFSRESSLGISLVFI